MVSPKMSLGRVGLSSIQGRHPITHFTSALASQVNPQENSPLPKRVTVPASKSTKNVTASPLQLHHKPQNPQPLLFEAELSRSAKQKLKLLDSIGIDVHSAVQRNPLLADSNTTRREIEEVIAFLQDGFGIEKKEVARLIRLYPTVLTAGLQTRLKPLSNFLQNEAKIPFKELRHVICRRPPLLVCSVDKQLRPTLCFLNSIGIKDLRKNYFLLPRSVESHLIPRLDFIERSFSVSRRNALKMCVRLPALFCYSIEGNIAPKSVYLVKDMGRSVEELKAFPQYFAFSLENRISPRHSFLAQNDIVMPLSQMLIPNDPDFYLKCKEWKKGFTVGL